MTLKLEDYQSYEIQLMQSLKTEEMALELLELQIVYIKKKIKSLKK